MFIPLISDGMQVSETSLVNHASFYYPTKYVNRRKQSQLTLYSL